MAKEPKPELIAETSAPTLLDGGTVTVETAAPAELKTVDYWAKQRGHVRTYDPNRPPRHIDVRLQKDDIPKAVIAHEKFQRARDPKHASIIAVDSVSGDWTPAEITGEQYDALVLDRFPALPTKGEIK